MTRTLKVRPLALAISLAAAGQAYAVGTGTIAGGTGTITQQGSVTNVNQTSDKLIVNWNNMDVGAGQTLNFNQPTQTAAVLNRVQSGNPTEILGALNAQGRVFVVNPNGVLIGSGAKVNVGSLVASTLDITDADFNRGRYIFSGTGKGKVTNEGTINAAESVALLGANNVSNVGTITAGSNIAMVSGGAVQLTFPSYGNMTVALSRGSVDALVRNGGLVRSTGGSIELRAWAIDAITRSVINNTGTLEATYVNSASSRKNASVTLESRGTGNVDIGGTVRVADAKSRIDVQGNQVNVGRDATLSSKGDIYLTSTTNTNIDGNLDASQGVLWLASKATSQGDTSTIKADGVLLSDLTASRTAVSEFDLTRGRNDIGWLEVNAKSAKVATVGDTTLGGVSTVGDLSVSSQKDLFINSAVTSGGNASLVAQNIKRNGTSPTNKTVSAGANVTLDAKDSIDLDIVRAGSWADATVTAQNGSINVARYVSGGTANVAAKGDIRLGSIDGSKSDVTSSAGNVTLDGGYALAGLNVTAQKDIVLNGVVNANNATMTAENIKRGQVNGGGTINATAGDVTLNARNNIDLDTVSVGRSNSATLTAQNGSVNVSRAVSAGNNVAVSGKGNVNLASVSAANASVASSNGGVSIASLNTFGNTNISAGAPGITLGTASVRGDLALKSTGKLKQTGLLSLGGNLAWDLAADSADPKIYRRY